MSDPDFTPNFDDEPALTDVDANEADVIEQNRVDLSQTPEDVDDGGTQRGYGDDAATEFDDANDYESGSDADFAPNDGEDLTESDDDE